MEWIHCNICFYQLGMQPKKEFVLTSCGHLFCQPCQHSGSVDQCKMCGINCNAIQLSPQMTSEVQLYFEDPETNIEKVLKVMEFQKCHRQRLNENYRKLVDKYYNLKSNYQRLEGEMNGLKLEIEDLKRKLNNNMMTPPPSSQGFPLFAKNSQASKAIRMGVSQDKTSNPASPFFATPANNSFRSQQFRGRKLTPSPLSEASSNSPLSVSSISPRESYRTAVGSKQGVYKSPLTPPMNSLRMLSVSAQKQRSRF